MRRSVVCLIGVTTLLILIGHGSAAAFRIAALFSTSLTIMAGLYIVTGLTRAVSLCHAALVGVGAYGASMASLRIGTPPVASILIGTIAAGGVAFVLSWATRKLDEHYLAFATLACSEILTNVFRDATSLTGGANGLTGMPAISFAGIRLDSPVRYIWPALLIALGALGLVHVIDRSSLGRALRAYGDQGLRVESLGVSAARLRVFGFTLGAMIAGLAGGTMAHIDGFVGPESFGVALSIAYLCFLVIGGLGSVRGLFVAASFASIAPELFRALVAWQMIIVSILAILVLYVRNDFATRSIGPARNRATPKAGSSLSPNLQAPRLRDPA